MTQLYQPPVVLLFSRSRGAVLLFHHLACVLAAIMGRMCGNVEVDLERGSEVVAWLGAGRHRHSLDSGLIGLPNARVDCSAADQTQEGAKTKNRPLFVWLWRKFYSNNVPLFGACADGSCSLHASSVGNRPREGVTAHPPLGIYVDADSNFHPPAQVIHTAVERKAPYFKLFYLLRFFTEACLQFWQVMFMQDHKSFREFR